MSTQEIKKELISKIKGGFTFKVDSEGGWKRYWDDNGRKGIKAMYHDNHPMVTISSKNMDCEITKEEFNNLLKK